MTKPLLALCSAIAITSPEGGSAPEWVHLIPAGGVILTADDRGPYTVEDYQALMTASLEKSVKLVLDENHSTDLAAPQGLPAPARAWIVDLQLRDGGEGIGGIWGKVEWTDEGRQLVEKGAYRGISPVIAHTKDKKVRAILRASLVNQPNFTGLTALNAEETDMDWKKKVAELLKLDGDAKDDAVLTALNAALDDGKVETALQSALSPIAKAAGLGEDAKPDAIVVAINTLQSAKDEGDVVSLQAELKELKADRAKEKAIAFVDGAIRDGRVGVKANRDDLISMHAESPAKAEKLINGMPKIDGGRLLDPVPADKAEDDLTPTQIAAHAAVYQKKLADGGQKIDFGAAVRAVQEGKHK